MKKIIIFFLLGLILGSCAATPEERQLVRQTAGESTTFQLQGTDVALNRLHPIFAKRLSSAIKEARKQGLNVGCFSAYRPPGFNIGKYIDKYNSLHAYGLACDVYGLGGPDDIRAFVWYHIAKRHNLWNPYYGTKSWAWEYNHYQMYKNIKKIPAKYKLRETIKDEGPKNIVDMWHEGTVLFFTQIFH